MASSSSHVMTDTARLVVAARHTVLEELVDSLMQGAPLIALTGEAGVGKTTLASAIHDELTDRSVHVMKTDAGGHDMVRLRTVTCQLLGKPETEFDEDDVEQLFDVMTRREPGNSRRVIIIDDADRLHAGVLEYLRLMSSLAPEQMPQIVFVGRSSFWNTADQPATSDLRDLIAERWEVDRLSSEETRALAGLMVTVPDIEGKPVIDDDALDALVRQGNGMIDRVVALVSVSDAIRNEWRQSGLTVAAIDAAAERLDSGLAADPQTAWPVSEDVAEEPVLPADAASAVGAFAEAPAPALALPAGRSGRLPGLMRAAVAAMALGLIGGVAYWRMSVPADHMVAQAKTAYSAVAATAAGEVAVGNQVEPMGTGDQAVSDSRSASETTAGGQGAAVGSTGEALVTASHVPAVPDPKAGAMEDIPPMQAAILVAPLPDATPVAELSAPFSVGNAKSQGASGIGEWVTAIALHDGLRAHGDSDEVAKPDAPAGVAVAEASSPQPKSEASPIVATPGSAPDAAHDGVSGSAGTAVDAPAAADAALSSPKAETLPVVATLRAMPDGLPLESGSASTSADAPPAAVVTGAPYPAVPMEARATAATLHAAPDGSPVESGSAGTIPEAPAAALAAETAVPSPTVPPEAPMTAAAPHDAPDGSPVASGSSGTVPEAPAAAVAAETAAPSPAVPADAPTTAVARHAAPDGSPVESGFAGTIPEAPAAAVAPETTAPSPAVPADAPTTAVARHAAPDGSPVASGSAGTIPEAPAGAVAAETAAPSPAVPAEAPTTAVAPHATPDGVPGEGPKSVAAGADGPAAPAKAASPIATASDTAPGDATTPAKPGLAPPDGSPGIAVKAGATMAGPPAAAVTTEVASPAARILAPKSAAAPPDAAAATTQIDVAQTPIAAAPGSPTGAAQPAPSDTGSSVDRPAARSAAPAGPSANAGAATRPDDAPKAGASAPGPSRLAPPVLAVLLARGDEMLALGDISAARLLYEKAASLGSARAATALGDTYDAAFLASIHAAGIAPDAAAASAWYRKGAALSDAEAAKKPARLAPAQ